MEEIGSRLASVLSRNWWVLLVRGLVAIAFGALCWARPGISLASLIAMFAAYALVDGVLMVWTALAGKHADDRWLLLLGGLVGIGVGIMTLARPGLSAVVLVLYISIWAIATGILQILAAIRLRREVQGEWVYILGAVITILFGVMLMSSPMGGALAMIWVLGAYALASGILLVIMGFRVRSLGRHLTAS